MIRSRKDERDISSMLVSFNYYYQILRYI